MDPTDFEQLIRQLFEATGLENWTTERSGHDGVDAIATSQNPFMGGLVVIQVKQRRHYLPLVRDLRQLVDAMDEKGAGRGVFVTQSWFSDDCWTFAA
jgi:restriction system protein